MDLGRDPIVYRSSWRAMPPRARRRGLHRRTRAVRALSGTALDERFTTS